MNGDVNRQEAACAAAVRQCGLTRQSPVDTLADVGPIPEGEALVEIRGCAGVLPAQPARGGSLTQLIQPGPEFRRLFDTFEHTAFRLEVRDRYDSSYENESLRKFLAGESDDLPWMQSWLSMIREATAKGRRFSRVRVVSIPLTDYSRFGVFCSQFTNAAGEDIRYLKRDQANLEGLPDHDYWLFDSRKLVWMHFDDADRFQGGEIIENSGVIVKHNYWSDVAWHSPAGGMILSLNRTTVVTNVHEAHTALGKRLRELRQRVGLSGRKLAESLSWPPSKVSKFENGRQTPTDEDIRSWTRETNSIGEAEALLASLYNT